MLTESALFEQMCDVAQRLTTLCSSKEHVSDPKGPGVILPVVLTSSKGECTRRVEAAKQDLTLFTMLSCNLSNFRINNGTSALMATETRNVFVFLLFTS